MPIIVVPAPPPREVEYELTHGGKLLTLTVQRVAGVSKRTGEVRYRSHTSTYLVERGAGLVRLVKDSGAVVTVTAFSCDCEDSSFKGKERLCKHLTAVRELGLMGAHAADVPTREGTR